MKASQNNLPPKQLAKEQLGKERLAKIIARAGICSRRVAESYILAGRVRIDKKIITNPAHNAGREQNIYVDGQRLTFHETGLWAFYKPVGLITTRKDEKYRATIFDCEALKQLESAGRQFITVGRLDLNSEGLLLLSNDGSLARYLEKSNLPRTYRVRVYGDLNMMRLNQLQSGATIDGVRYRGIKIALDNIVAQAQSDSRQLRSKALLQQMNRRNQWLTITIYEGKNREVRRMLEWCGGSISRLIRVSFGEFTLSNLSVGEVRGYNSSILRQNLADFWQS